MDLQLSWFKYHITFWTRKYLLFIAFTFISGVGFFWYHFTFYHFDFRTIFFYCYISDLLVLHFRFVCITFQFCLYYISILLESAYFFFMVVLSYCCIVVLLYCRIYYLLIRLIVIFQFTLKEYSWFNSKLLTLNLNVFYLSQNNKFNRIRSTCVLSNLFCDK